MYDLIVVGAGPAGSTAARTAAILGMDTLILEKNEFPRYKACGGALSERAATCLDYSLPQNICERSITGARVHFKDQVTEVHKGYNLTTLVTRSVFDHFLLQKAEEAGARVSFQKVSDFKDGGDHVSVQAGDGIYHSRFLVIASGCQSPLKSSVWNGEPSDDIGICLVAEIDKDDRDIEAELGSLLDIHLGVAKGGYGWVFPHKGYYSVGVGGLASELYHPRQIMRDFLQGNKFNGAARVHGHSIPLGGMRGKIAQGRVLLAGDAAGLADSFTGEGIYYALRSGKLAGEAIGEERAAKAAGSYQKRCKRELGEELRYALILSRIMHRYPNMFSWVVERHDVLERYIEIAAAQRSYRDFVHWLIPRLPYRHLFPLK